jgi:hypothetical protein
MTMSPESLDRVRFVTRHFNDLQGLRLLVPLGLMILSLGGATYFANRSLVLVRGALFLAGTLLLLGAPRYYRRRFGEVEPECAAAGGELYALSIYSPAGSLPPLAGAQGMAPRAKFLLLALGVAFTIFFVAQAIAPTVAVEVDDSLVQPPWATLDSVVLFMPDWSRGIDAVLHKPAPGPNTFRAVAGQLLYALCGSLLLATWLWRRRFSREPSRSQSYHLALALPLLALSITGTCLGYFVWDEGRIANILNFLLPALVHLWVALLLCGAALIAAGLLDHRQLARALGRPVEEP